MSKDRSHCDERKQGQRSDFGGPAEEMIGGTAIIKTLARAPKKNR